MGVDVAGEDDGGGSAMNGATAPGVGGDCGVAGKGRRGAAVRLVGVGGARGVGTERGGGGRSRRGGSSGEGGGCGGGGGTGPGAAAFI